MPKRFDLVVAGEINPDLILELPAAEVHFDQQEVLIERARLTIGSSSAIFACGAARLGLRVALVGVVGEDVFGDFMLAELSRRGVDTRYAVRSRTINTGYSVILNHKKRRSILTVLGAINALRASDIPDELLRSTRHLHVASYFLQTNLQPDLVRLFQEARSSGASTSLDTNWDPDEKWQGVYDLLKETTLFLPNENEARSIAGTGSVEEAARRLAAHGPTVAVKLGGDGALVCTGQAMSGAPALPVEVVDTVGAGDSFDAGYVYGFLRGWEPERCLGLAVICGSLSTRQHGGTDAQPGLEEALAWLSTR